MRSTLLTLMCVGLLTVGCDRDSATSTTNPSEARPTSVASKHLLSDEPSDAIALTEAAESLGSESKSITLIGKIDAGEFSAFQEAEATFMLSELPQDGHGVDDPDHEDNCPFCKRRAANAPKAIVQIVDDEGNVIPTDARQLLGVQKGDRVIASGNATFDDSVNAITVQCEKIYLLR